MKILVLNSGSSSIKFQLFEMEDERVLASGLIEQIGEISGRATLKSSDAEPVTKVCGITDHQVGLEMMQEMLKEAGFGSFDAIGHRVVHGGEVFHVPTLIDDEVLQVIEGLSPLAPLHNPANAAGIRVAKSVNPTLPQVAVFDTAFHQTLPKHAYLYALPYELYEKADIRRYGFHGTSHAFVAQSAAEYLNQPPESLNLITLHLGNGASATAIKAGKSIDTSMGMTPLEGLVMGTRSGDLDPAILFYLARKYGMSIDELDQLLNKQSGLKGISGKNDLRSVTEAAASGDEQAKTAMAMMGYRIKKYIGAYTAALGRVDAIVFTGGIGEHSVEMRNLACEGLSDGLGIMLDPDKNSAYKRGVMELHSDQSRVKVLVVPTNEELEIARQTKMMITS
ncbi:MAG: acetate kinase [Campylobacterota bacterium]|nr:acetate kinase [Campylobacterota bacterium]